VPRAQQQTKQSILSPQSGRKNVSSRKKAGRSNMWPRKISTEEKNCKVYLTKLLGFYLKSNIKMN